MKPMKKYDIFLWFRIGADIVEQDIQVILRRDHGDPRHYVQFIT